MSKVVTVHATFTLRVSHDVQVPDDFDVDCEAGTDEDAAYLADRLDNADFVEIVNAAGGGEWEVDTWDPGPK